MGSEMCIRDRGNVIPPVVKPPVVNPPVVKPPGVNTGLLDGVLGGVLGGGNVIPPVVKPPVVNPPVVKPPVDTGGAGGGPPSGGGSGGNSTICTDQSGVLSDLGKLLSGLLCQLGDIVENALTTIDVRVLPKVLGSIPGLLSSIIRLLLGGVIGKKLVI